MECPRVSGLAAVTFILLIAFALSSAFVLRHSKLVRRDHLSLPSLSPLSCAPGFPRLRPQFALPIELRRAQRSPSAVPLRSRKRPAAEATRLLLPTTPFLCRASPVALFPEAILGPISTRSLHRHAENTRARSPAPCCAKFLYPKEGGW